MLVHADELQHIVYAVPEDIDQAIAELKLQATGIEIDMPSPATRFAFELL